MYLYQEIRTVVKETKRIPQSIIKRTNAFPIVLKATSSKSET